MNPLFFLDLLANNFSNKQTKKLHLPFLESQFGCNSIDQNFAQS